MEDYLAAKKRLQLLSRQQKRGSAATGPRLPDSSSSLSSSPSGAASRSSPRRQRSQPSYDGSAVPPPPPSQQEPQQHRQSNLTVRGDDGGDGDGADEPRDRAPADVAATARRDVEAAMEREKDLVQQLDEADTQLAALSKIPAAEQPQKLGGLSAMVKAASLSKMAG